MGIKGLLPKLEYVQQAITVEELRGHKVGIEASSWLYKGKLWPFFCPNKVDRPTSVFLLPMA